MPDLQELRKQIDEIDDAMVSLFEKRMSIAEQVANYKIETGKTIPSLKTANDIANALDVCIYQIFDLDGTGHYKCLDSNCSNN